MASIESEYEGSNSVSIGYDDWPRGRTRVGSRRRSGGRTRGIELGVDQVRRPTERAYDSGGKTRTGTNRAWGGCWLSRRSHQRGREHGRRGGAGQELGVMTRMRAWPWGDLLICEPTAQVGWGSSTVWEDDLTRAASNSFRDSIVAGVCVGDFPRPFRIGNDFAGSIG